MKIAHLVCAVDKHSSNLPPLIKSLRELYPNDDIKVVNFYSEDEASLVRSVCDKISCDFESFKMPKEIGDRVSCNESLAMLVISESFYARGYDKVFLLHGDIDVFDDYTKKFDCGDEMWSVAAPLIDYTSPKTTKELSLAWEYLSKYNSWEIGNGTSLRLTQSCVLINKKFIDEILRKHFNIFTYFNLMLSNIHPCGDCGMFDWKSFGYSPRPILNQISFEMRWMNGMNSSELKRVYKDLSYIHYGL